MKKVLLFFIFLSNTFFVRAQENIPYAEKAAQLQKEIWGKAAPEFKVTTVPADLSKESAVVLARSYSLQRTSNGRVKFLIITAGSTTRTAKLTTLHERVKINDKVALEAYSSISYQKKLDKSVSILIAKMTNINNTYVGAKVIKPDGREVIVNTSEEVLLKNETKDQKGKLAISDLQVGDILDYYVSSVDLSENSDPDSYKDNDDVFLLAEDYPVLYYSLDFQYNKKTIVHFLYANGAPHFVESHNDAGDLLLSLKIRNMAKLQSGDWISPLRQFPYIEIGSIFENKFTNFLLNQKAEDPKLSRLDANKNTFEELFKETPYYDEAETRLKKFFKTSKAFKNAPLDSSMKVFYDELKFMAFCSYNGNELEDVSNLNYRHASGLRAAILMSMMLTDMKINYSVLLVASRYSNSIDNVYNLDDMDAMVMINGSKPMYLCFDDVVTHFNEIPARYQGEKAIVLNPKRHSASKYTFTEGTTTLPVTASDKNVSEEHLEVSFLPANMQKLKINRIVMQQGELRHAEQKRLIPVGDVDDGYMKMVNGDDLKKRLSKYQETRKMKKDYEYSFTKEKTEMSKNFTSEIKSQFDQEPEDVADVKIENTALENTNPVFKYSATFVLNNMVKKAGPNYIIDAGRLVGSFVKLEEKDRKRSVDIFMPCARTFKYTVVISIPQGYSAKGVEEMNINKSNQTGSFSSSASVNGNSLTFTVTRVYNNSFEKATDWPMLTEIIDTASKFNTQKILLEKKG